MKTFLKRPWLKCFKIVQNHGTYLFNYLISVRWPKRSSSGTPPCMEAKIVNFPILKPRRNVDPKNPTVRIGLIQLLWFDPKNTCIVCIATFWIFCPMPNMVEKRIPWSTIHWMYSRKGTAGPEKGLQENKTIVFQICLR